jgi:hypothetical protein
VGKMAESVRTIVSPMRIVIHVLLISVLSGIALLQPPEEGPKTVEEVL